MNYKVSKKIGDKFKTFGNIKINQWGKPQLSLKVTPELKEMVNSNEWLNFNLFEDDGGNYKSKPPAQPIDDDIMF